MQFILRGAVHATPFHSFRAPACTLLQVGTGLTDNQKNDGSSRLPLAGVTPAQVAVQVFQPCWVPCDRLVGPMQGWQAPGQQWMATVYQPDARASSGVFETQDHHALITKGEAIDPQRGMFTQTCERAARPAYHRSSRRNANDDRKQRSFGDESRGCIRSSTGSTEHGQCA